MGDIILRITCFLSILASGLSQADKPENDCIINSKNGTCVEVIKCPAAYELLKQKDLKSLQSLQCGFEKDKPMVCCVSAENAIVFNKNDEETATNRPTAKTTTKPVEFIPLIPEKPLDPLPSKEVCGKVIKKNIQNRIHGGINTDIKEFPWVARLKYDETFDCGATLISDRYVITAAHCLRKAVDGLPQSVRLGEWDEETEKDCKENICNNKPVDVNITGHFMYPEFNPANKTIHDIALLKLEEPVNFTDFIQPICLPTTEYVSMQDYLSDSSYFAAGWGMTEYDQPSPIKRKVKLQAVTVDVCSGIYPQVPKTSFPYLICAGGREGKDTCRGDSGGPLFKQVMENYQNNWYLFGITSAGFRHCGAEGSPGLYTRVTKYMDWIRDVISKD